MLDEKLKALKTPCYIIDSAQLERNCAEIEEAFEKQWNKNIIYGYSIKTNHHPYVIDVVKLRGWRAEVVSEKEYQLARKLGYEAKDIIYNGPIKGKSLKDVLFKKGIVNIDNFEEIKSILSYDLPLNTRVGLRINFDLEQYCKGETTAGKYASRFGFCYENGDVKKAIDILKRNNVTVAGLHMHVSTKTRSVKVFRKIAETACEIQNKYNLQLNYIDIGGGFFGGQIVRGKPTMEEYAKTICGVLSKEFEPLQTAIVLEPGASVAATAVYYLTRVNSIKQIRDEIIVTLDGTSLHINPFMSVRSPQYAIIGQTSEKMKIQHICGNTCMEADRFICLENKGRIEPDAMFVFYNAGAYTMCLNSYFINEFPNIYTYQDNEYILLEK